MSDQDRPEIAPANLRHAMRCPDGSLLYPDDENDARWFADEHEATPVWPDAFPFDIAERVARARVTLTFEVLASQPIGVTDNRLLDWVADRFGHVVDAGPYVMVTSPLSDPLGKQVSLGFGSIYSGPVEWLDGSAPESGWHCGDCRQPKRLDAGPCLRSVLFRGREFPCDDSDADHHGSCRFSPLRNGRSDSAHDVA